MNVKILGTGCPNCQRLEALVREVATAQSLAISVDKVTDIAEIMSYGVMSTPALVVDGRLQFAGRVPPKHELAAILGAATAQADR